MGVSFRVVLYFRFRVEGPFAAPLPEREGVAIALRAGGQIEHRAIERCSIVVGQFDEPGFLDEAAQLYEMAGAFATLHDPSSRIGAALGGFNPVPRLRQLGFRLRRCRKRVAQPCRSEERRCGTECARTCNSRWSQT